jgi:hypothetical protein
MTGYVIRVVSTEGLDLPSPWFVSPQNNIVSVCEDLPAAGGHRPRRNIQTDRLDDIERKNRHKAGFSLYYLSI